MYQIAKNIGCVTAHHPIGVNIHQLFEGLRNVFQGRRSLRQFMHEAEIFAQSRTAVELDGDMITRDVISSYAQLACDFISRGEPVVSQPLSRSRSAFGNLL